MCAEIMISCTNSVVKQSLCISYYIRALLSTKIVPKSCIVFTSAEHSERKISYSFHFAHVVVRYFPNENIPFFVLDH